MTHHDRQLGTLLNAEYEKAPHKGNFLLALDNMAGVLTSHESEHFCLGYMLCMGRSGQSTSDLYTVRVYSKPDARHYLVDDKAKLIAAVTGYHKDKREIPTPRKIITEMVRLRMFHILDAHNKCASFLPKNSSPVLDSRSAYATYVAGMIHRVERQMGRNHTRMVKEILERNDIPDDAFPDAWNLLLVKGVMDS